MLTVRLICREYKYCIDSATFASVDELIEFVWKSWGSVQTRGKVRPSTSLDLIAAWEGLRRDSYLEIEDIESKRRERLRQMREIMREFGILDMVLSCDKIGEIDQAVENYLRSN